MSEYILLLFFDPLKTPHKVILNYADVLQRKYQSNHLQIIGISVRDEKSTEKLTKHGNYSLSIISDYGKKIHSQFDLKECCGGAVFFNKERRTVFFEKILPSDDILRQITEKYLPGKINYTFSTPKERILFKTNSILPPLKFRKEWAHDKIAAKELMDKRTILTFFTSMCSSCTTGKRIETLKKIKKIFESQKSESNFYLVFFHPMDENDLIYWQQDIKFPFDKIICYDEIFTEEEKYISDSSFRLNPVTLVVEPNMEVIFIERFGMGEDSLIENLKGLKVASK